MAEVVRTLSCFTAVSPRSLIIETHTCTQKHTNTHSAMRIKGFFRGGGVYNYLQCVIA